MCPRGRIGERFATHWVSNTDCWGQSQAEFGARSRIMETETLRTKHRQAGPHEAPGVDTKQSGTEPLPPPFCFIRREDDCSNIAIGLL